MTPSVSMASVGPWKRTGGYRGTGGHPEASDRGLVQPRKPPDELPSMAGDKDGRLARGSLELSLMAACPLGRPRG